MNRAAVGAALHYCCVSWDVHFARRHPILFPGAKRASSTIILPRQAKDRQAPGWTGGITRAASKAAGIRNRRPAQDLAHWPATCHRQTREQMKCLELHHPKHTPQAHLISHQRQSLHSRHSIGSPAAPVSLPPGSGCQQSPGGAAGLASEPAAQSFEFEH